MNQNDINDSEIIQSIEHEKCNDPKFDINLGLGGKNWSLLMVTANDCRKELVEYLLTDPNIDVNHRSNTGETVLYACNDVSIFKLLISCSDLDVNIQNDRRETGLHRECYRGRKSYVKEYLLDARINTSIRDDQGKTARDYALEWRYSRIAKIINNSRHTTLLRIPNKALLHDIVRMIIEEYV